jgi:hypothetical protein
MLRADELLAGLSASGLIGDPPAVGGSSVKGHPGAAARSDGGSGTEGGETEGAVQLQPDQRSQVSSTAAVSGVAKPASPHSDSHDRTGDAATTVEL